MKHLYRTEFARFKAPMIGFSVGHLAVLAGIIALTDLFAASNAKLAIGGLIYGLGGLIFGLYQMGTHQRVNRWTYLIHRPLSLGQIFASLSAAAVTFFVIVGALPLLLATLYLDAMTSQWVDLRHYLLALFVPGTMLAFYFAGAAIALSVSRLAVLLLVVPSLFLTQYAAGTWIFLPLMITIGWLAYIAFVAFKPDLTTPVAGPVAVVATALPVQYALFLLLLAVSAVAHQTMVVFELHGLRGFAVHAWNDYFPEGTIDRVNYLNDTELLAHGLARVDEADRDRLMPQIGLADTALALPQIRRYPVRHQPMFMDVAVARTDAEAGIRWTYSHDRGVFHGRDLLSGKVAGWLGPSGIYAADDAAIALSLDRFTEVPMALGDRWIVTSGLIFEVDDQAGTVTRRIELPDGERFLQPLVHHDSLATALSNRHLYIFDPRDFDRQSGVVAPISTVPLSFSDQEAAVGGIKGVAFAELIDSYLVTVVSERHSGRDFGTARQVMIEVPIAKDEAPVLLGDIELGQGWPAWYRHRGLIMSPAMQTGHDLVRGWVAPRRPDRVSLGMLLDRSLPRSVLAVVLLVALLSAGLTAVLVRHRQLSRGSAIAWVVGALCFGLPVPLSLWALTARHERLPREAPSALALGLGQVV